MPLECNTATSGGKGNRGMFRERDPKVYAAGVPTAQSTESVSDSLQHYLLKDEADALLSDAIFPTPKPRPLPPLRHPTPPDKRNAGPYGDMSEIMQPHTATKFQSLVKDFKDTLYASYWTKPLGKVKDPVPMLPEGFDIEGTTFGKPTQFDGRLYDIVMPKDPCPDKTPISKRAGVQVQRGYCSPPYRKDLTYGHRSHVDKRGKYGRCCLTDNRIVQGIAHRAIINSIQSNFLDAHQPRIGEVLAPNNNIDYVPKDYSFGKLTAPDNLPECLTFCQINTGVAFLRSCLKHLNTIRKGLSKRVLPHFFHDFFLYLKYYDKEKTGWLPKDIVYQFCGTRLIRFDPALIEPLLTTWEAFDGSKIKYDTFVRVFNYRIPSPEIPKVLDIPEDCLDFRTTYTEMVKPGQEPNVSLRAGLPSGRYFDADFPITPDRLCRADRTCLPQESDVKSCICPSVMTLLFVTHRDMYQKREPNVVRRVFEAAGEKFSDNRFNALWEEAKKFHSQGWVCYETFARTLAKHPDPSEFDKEIKTEK